MEKETLTMRKNIQWNMVRLGRLMLTLMFHGSINERDPGVQVTLPQKPLETINHDDKDTHNRRTEFNISRSQKSTFQPTVRRYGRKFSCGNEDIEIM